ncbi:MAG: AAA family ATPase [Cytophagales bacterium]|nr:AAA family ATPase [Cytophagales bacterium]
MFIKSLYIENFRCFKEVELDFETLTILVGENGTGKTSVLEAINYALTPGFLSNRISEEDFCNTSDGEIKIEVVFNESFKTKLPDGFSTKEIPCDRVLLQVKRREKAAPNKALSI